MKSCLPYFMIKFKKIWKIVVLGIVAILLLFASYDFVRNIFEGSTDKSLQSKNVMVEDNPISQGETPLIPFSLPNGYIVHVFARDLGNPRSLLFTPEGTLLVSNPTQNSVVALPDKNRDGIADENKTVITSENHVHGLAMHNGELFVANVDSVVKYGWDEARTTATRGPVLFSLPQNGNHNNRSIVFDEEGNMFVSLGSTCNVCNEPPTKGGSVLKSDFNGKTPTVFATGLRNAAFLALNPVSKELWATEMGRDNLGDDTPPDEINIVRAMNDYGWPKCYGIRIHDTNFDKGKVNPCANTISPIYEIPAHSAPLGLAFINSTQFPEEWQGDLLVALHGSWNRTIAIGYKVVHLTVRGNTITGSEDFMTGFNPGIFKDTSLGRPVGLAFDKRGNLFISDDKSGQIYIVQKKK